MNDTPIQKVLSYQPLFELVKDFAGILAEYPLYFITKKPPRKWGFLWTRNTWIVPSQRDKCFVVETNVEIPHIQTIQQGNWTIPGSRSVQCFYDEHRNAWPIHTGSSQKQSRLKVWNDLNTDQKPSISNGRNFWYIRPLSICIAYILEDVFKPNVCSTVQESIFTSADFNLFLAKWYDKNLFTMIEDRDKRETKKSQFSQLRKHFENVCLQSIHISNITKTDVLWIDPNFFSSTQSISFWVKYHFQELSWIEWIETKSGGSDRKLIYFQIVYDSGKISKRFFLVLELFS